MKGTTFVTANLEDGNQSGSVKNCENPGCSSHEIDYDTTVRQLALLADASHYCRQYIRVNQN